MRRLVTIACVLTLSSSAFGGRDTQQVTVRASGNLQDALNRARPGDSIRTYLPGAAITRNVIAGGDASAHPSGNLFPSLDELRRQFTDFAAHDYRLVPRSPWLKMSDDGRPLGADLARVPSARERR